MNEIKFLKKLERTGREIILGMYEYSDEEEINEWGEMFHSLYMYLFLHSKMAQESKIVKKQKQKNKQKQTNKQKNLL